MCTVIKRWFSKSVYGLLTIGVMIGCVVIVVICVLVGCTVKGTVSATYTGLYHCTDLRDGEKWDYNTATIRDVQVGLNAPTRATYTDTTGRVRVAYDYENAYIKCVPDASAQLTKAVP